MKNKGKLNKVEVWLAEHAVPVFLTIAALIIVGAIAVFVTYEEQSSTAEQVKVLKPQVTRVNKAICDAQSLDHPDRSRRCAERIRVGLINCRHVESCRAALIAAITFPPASRPEHSSTTATTTSPSSTKGVMPQPPSHHGHQHSGPGSQPGPTPSPGPSPSPSPAPAPEHGKPAETPGNGPQNGHGHGPSGVGVEVCALERCAGAEVGLPIG